MSEPKNDLPNTETQNAENEIASEKEKAKNRKKRIKKYRGIVIISIAVTALTLKLVFPNITANDIIVLSLPLLLTAFFGYLAAEDVFKEKSKGRNMIQVVLTFLAALAIGFASKSSSNTQALITKAERDSLQKVSDSIIAAKVAVKVDSIYGGISKSFNDQGLKLDVVNFEVTKLRDSAKTIVMNAQVKNPILDIYNQNILFVNETLDSLIFKIGVVCQEEAAKDIKLNYIAEIDYTIGKDETQYAPIYFDNMAVGQAWATDISLTKRLGTIKSVTFLFYGKCRGTYPNSKEFKIDPIVYIYNMNTKWATRYTGNTKKNWIEKYKPKGFDL